MSATISRRLQPGLWQLTRPSGTVLWMAMANGITLLSYSEEYARVWLSREQDQPEDDSKPPTAA